MNAGWFDSSDSNMTEHDFGNFTMKVPKNATFDDNVQLNGEDAISKLAELEGGSVSVEYNDSKWANPKYKDYFHPQWDDESNKISIQYIDCNEDDITMDNAVEASYIDYEESDSKDDCKEYYSSTANNYIVIKNNQDKSIVLVSYEDKDILWKMVDSIKFK